MLGYDAYLYALEGERCQNTRGSCRTMLSQDNNTHVQTTNHAVYHHYKDVKRERFAMAQSDRVLKKVDEVAQESRRPWLGSSWGDPRSCHVYETALFLLEPIRTTRMVRREFQG